MESKIICVQIGINVFDFMMVTDNESFPSISACFVDKLDVSILDHVYHVYSKMVT